MPEQGSDEGEAKLITKQSTLRFQNSSPRRSILTDLNNKRKKAY